MDELFHLWSLGVRGDLGFHLERVPLSTPDADEISSLLANQITATLGSYSSSLAPSANQVTPSVPNLNASTLSDKEAGSSQHGSDTFQVTNTVDSPP